MDTVHGLVLLVFFGLFVWTCWDRGSARSRERRLRNGLTIDPRWQPLVKDARLLEALAILQAHVPIMCPYIKKMRKRRVQIVIAPDKNDGYAAYYSHSRNLIAITEPVMREPPTVLAAVLAHELGHIRKHGGGSIESRADVRASVEDELTSHTLEAIVWRTIRTGREGTRWAAKMNRQLAAYNRDELVGFITANPFYQKYFFGQTLKAKGIKV